MFDIFGFYQRIFTIYTEKIIRYASPAKEENEKIKANGEKK